MSFTINSAVPIARLKGFSTKFVYSQFEECKIESHRPGRGTLFEVLRNSSKYVGLHVSGSSEMLS